MLFRQGELRFSFFYLVQQHLCDKYKNENKLQREMASNLMICTSALKPLSAKKLNESEATGKKYILPG